ncbi:MAG: NADPH-dependent glutamate synthase [Treponema sp.]|jgi:glutamate synthase (NADPH/NADH) small chain|nr:NADPH-dependent glutamate synthase [Treponema sp.]
MANMSLYKNKMPLQDPAVRSGNFFEVALGYSEEQAVDEAKRCLGCKNKPCIKECPVTIDIPSFIAEIAAGEFEKAYEVINRYNSLPAICGRVCPQETQCESTCVRGRKGEPVAIGRLERFAADYHNLHAESAGTVQDSKTAPSPQLDKKVKQKAAVIGSGPSGLACAGSLAKKGYGVTIFEALHIEGGVLGYGIPEFRLPKAIVRKEIQGLKDMGVEIALNTVIGKTLTIDELFGTYGYGAVFIGSGAGLPKFMNIPGENLNGVYSANEFLTRINLMNAYIAESTTPIHGGKKVVVVGGGNVAMDAARCARRLGAEVTIVYRRTEKELPARLEEVEHAKEENINFMFLTNPLIIQGNDTGWVSSISCQKMVLGAADQSGRARPVPLEGSEFSIETDCVIMAIGTSPNPLIKSTTSGLAVQPWGGIIVDEKTGKTSREGVYAGGDAVTGAATVILAMGAGKIAAKAIDSYLKAI